MECFNPSDISPRSVSGGRAAPPSLVTSAHHTKGSTAQRCRPPVPLKKGPSPPSEAQLSLRGSELGSLRRRFADNGRLQLCHTEV